MPNVKIFWDPYLPNPLQDSRQSKFHRLDKDSDFLLLGGGSLAAL
jgi:hypothetical protein